MEIEPATMVYWDNTLTNRVIQRGPEKKPYMFISRGHIQQIMVHPYWWNTLVMRKLFNKIGYITM